MDHAPITVTIDEDAVFIEQTDDQGGEDEMLHQILVFAGEDLDLLIGELILARGKLKTSGERE